MRSAREEMRRRGWAIISGERRATTPKTGEWYRTSIETPRGTLTFDERTIVAPSGRAAIQRRNGRLNGRWIHDAYFRALVTGADLPHVVGETRAPSAPYVPAPRRFTGD